MCANPKSIREIMIAAEELNMIDSGEYVFFNIEIFGSLTKDYRVSFFKNVGHHEKNYDTKKNSSHGMILTMLMRGM